MPEKKSKKNKKGLLARLFPGWSRYQEDEAKKNILPYGSLGSSGVPNDIYGSLMMRDGSASSIGTAADAAPGGCNEDFAYRVSSLPADRLLRYPIFRVMASDPTIAAALRLHVASAVSADPYTGQSITIDSVNDNDQGKYVLELKRAMEPLINENAHRMAYQTALYGIAFARIYGKKGKGLTNFQNNYWTFPGFVHMFERSGDICGYTCPMWQKSKLIGGHELMAPWLWAEFKMPMWKNSAMAEPVRADGKPYYIDSELEEQGIIECQNYGESMLANAFDSWWDLQQGIVAMNMSRQAAARIEQLCAVDMGGMTSPDDARKYISTIMEIMDKTNREKQRVSLRRGVVPTVLRHFFPVFSKSGKGKLDINTVESSPNINALEDLLFHGKRLAASLGVDLGLVGFGEQLSGGLGEGGFLRTSILAANKSEMIRHALISGFDKMCELHLFWKFGKVFPEKPWRIQFHSAASALELETRASQETGVNLATALSALVAELAEANNPAFSNFILTDVCRLPEDKVTDFLKKVKPPPDDGEEDDDGGGGSRKERDDGSERDREREKKEKEKKKRKTRDDDDEDDEDDDDRVKKKKERQALESALKSEDGRHLLFEAVRNIVRGEG